LIKNPGGTIAAGYAAGRADLVEAAACRLTAPGIGSSGGATFDQIGCCFKGCFSRPKWWGSDERHTAYVFEQLGYPVNPQPMAPRRDVIQAIRLVLPKS